MMLSRGKYCALLSAGIITMLAVLSCQKELISEELQPKETISFSVRKDSEAVRKSCTSTNEASIEVGGENFSLYIDSEHNTGAESSTRGIPYDNGDHKIPSINVTALIEKGTGDEVYIQNDVVTIQDGTGESDRYWPDTPLSFFAYATSNGNATVSPTFIREDGKCKGTFSYTLPAAAASSPKKDASGQPDVVFAITPDQGKTTNSGEVDLLFHHALSALVFKVGQMPDETYLTSIAIEGVYSSGTCSMKAEGADDVVFEWDYTGKNADGTYTEELSSQLAAEGDQIGNEEAVFMMLPQEFGSDSEAKLTLNFNIGGKDYNRDVFLKDIISAWEPDKKYIFTLGVPSDVDVRVEDMVEGKVKTDVTIQNTGTEAGYIRAAIVGYWASKAGDVVMPWDSADGEFAWGSDWATYWKKGSDGFYYHLSPVGANQFTHPLFETYTLTASTEAGSAHSLYTLEMSIVSQIIPEDQIALWPELNK